MKQESLSYIKKDILIFFYYESYETSEACLLGKMTKTPFTGNSGHISVDIVTLIDDHSRYGYVYLIYIYIKV